MYSVLISVQCIDQCTVFSVPYQNGIDFKPDSPEAQAKQTTEYFRLVYRDTNRAQGQKMMLFQIRYERDQRYES